MGSTELHFVRKLKKGNQECEQFSQNGVDLKLQALITHLCHLLWICLPLRPKLQLLYWLHWQLYLQSGSGFNHICKCWILEFFCTYHFPLAFLLFEDYRSANTFRKIIFQTKVH